MPRFLVGDELGSIKAVTYDAKVPSDSKTQLKTLYDGTGSGRSRGIQRLAVITGTEDDTLMLASAHADGSLCISSLTGEDQLQNLHQWKETRLKSEQKFIGLAISQNTVFSCTSNGALRLSTLGEETRLPTHKLAALPSKLTEWRIGCNKETFAYGGDDVELSVWNTERAFQPSSPSEDASSISPVNTKKRKRAGDTLFPGEIWRAKNVPNDFLDLRQPVHNTCLTYISPSSSTGQQHLLAGTRFGDVRRYDTRAGRRPVSDFKSVGKIGGVRAIEKGLSEHEAFVSDQGSSLFALDLRSGGILYSYKGISGAVTSVSPSPLFLASVALDRYTRIHSTSLVPTKAGNGADKRGTTLEKVYMTTVPTVVVWDQQEEMDVDQEEDENIWETMKHVEE
ncbi:hypothetical protein F5J12DRAFT_715033 [Pisolithus orientalis]|uniref:uncharacterized protein n=1 Tax=Pisolithus orientalis TaxID=936130 RepID=UPI0022240EF6|nr:uncharacterized protein F5J12DRAFT_715033 [Pisolithus orientalis]KAI6028356.1 hypothetical protein F5J12DRAFT_715033 [Pisolithus orientalis]